MHAKHDVKCRGSDRHPGFVLRTVVNDSFACLDDLLIILWSFVPRLLARNLRPSPSGTVHDYATEGLSVTGDGGGGSGSSMNPSSLLGEGGGPPSSENCSPSEK